VFPSPADYLGQRRKLVTVLNH